MGRFLERPESNDLVEGLLVGEIRNFVGFFLLLGRLSTSGGKWVVCVVRVFLFGGEVCL